MTSDITLTDASFFPRLAVKVGGRIVQEVDLRAELRIGRAEDNDLQLMDPKASRHHARVQREGMAYILTDLGSANGTRVNGVRLTAPHSLQHGERITIGDTEMIYQEPGRSIDDTITAAELPVALQASMAAQAAQAVPSPPPPAAAKSVPRGKGGSQGLVIGLVVAAAVALLALVAIAVFFLAPDVYERIGLFRPASPTPPQVAASATTPAVVETPAETPSPATGAPTPETSPIDPQEVNDLLVQAEALTRRGKFEDAIAIYQDLTSRAPNDARPEVGWAWALILDDQADEALAHALRARDLEPTSAEAAAVLSRAYLETGEKTEALTLAQEAVQIAPGSAKAHAVLADAYMQDGQIQKAVDEADLALVQDINSAEAHRIRGWLYHLADNDLGRAASELQIAAGLQPELWLRRHELGLLLLEAEDYVTAIMAFQDALAIRPKAKTYTAIGETYYRLGQYDQAKASVQQAISAGADDVDTYGLMAATFAHLNRCDDAKTYFEQALAMDATHPLASEARDLCREGGPSPTPSPTTAPASQPTPASTPGATPRPTKPPAPPPSLSGRIVFPVWNVQRFKYDTYIANLDGSERSLVIEEMHQPALSPDGMWVAVNGERHEHMDLFILHPNGSHLQEISKHLEDGLPCWSPDGKGLVFSSTQHGDKQSRVYIIDEVPFGGGKVEGRPLNFGPDDVRGEYPTWTADDRIVYKGCDYTVSPATCGLFIMSAKPGPQRYKQLTEHPEDTAPAAFGDRIAFMSNRDGNWEIYVMSNDGSGLKRLTNNAANDGLPTWSPDGNTLAFVSDQGGAWAIWAMGADGSNRRKLFPVGGGGLTFDWQHERISWGR